MMGDYNKLVECFFCRRQIPLASARHPEDCPEWVCDDAAECDAEIARCAAARRRGRGESMICNCGLEMSKNPHPQAGEPDFLEHYGAVWVCIPCTVKALSGWHRRYAEAAEMNRRRAQREAIVVAHLGRDKYQQIIEEGLEAGGKDE